ncbi:hypothetical protein NIES2107_59640 [Nostoc carneum NIES-2107]|nr:hypothetical protein NIES2107_59640 [Nostoc carneum NIES-2107]
MQLIKIVATINIIAFVAIPVGIQNSAAALDSNQKSSENLMLLNKNQIALNDIYIGPNRDFEIMMPGIITENNFYKLISVSPNKTVYTMMNTDFPEASRIPIPQIRQILQSAMRETIGLTGKVIRSTNLEIDNYPGLELLMQHSDGSLGQYRAFVVNQRLYFMGALTPDELTTESVNFFDSFRVYPE